MTISTAPAVPNPTSASFATDAYHFTQWMAAAATEMNAEITRINALGFGSYSATSTTSLTFATGSKSLTVQAGKGFVPGQPVIISETATPTNNMVGVVTGYDSTTGALVVNVSDKNGTGTATAWTISVSATVVGGGVSPDSVVVLTSGTSWTCPTGVTKAIVRVQGAGGGGAGTSASLYTPTGFGSGGGTAVAVIALTPGGNYAYAIGAGGAGGAVSASGAVGSSSTFTANGVTYTGSGGGGGPFSGAFGARGTATNGQENILGGFNGATATGYGCGGKPANAGTGVANAGTAGDGGAIILELFK